ncbi:14838_t:CDS:2 [Entrophospora sp. SA101]|nr:14838_t:CDS:2 [Entrophospora sp. SA101]
MGIKIIGFGKSPTTLRVILTLQELGLEHEFEEGVYNEMKSPDFLATKNPFGKVPVMIDDGFTLYESRAICRYLVNKYQGTKNSTILIPKDIQKAALVEQYLSVESLYFDLPSTAINFEEIVAVKYMNREADAEKVKEAKEKIENTLDIYEKFLEGKDYLIGEYSLADLVHIANIYVNVHKTSAKDVYYDAKRPNVVKWAALVEQYLLVESLYFEIPSTAINHEEIIYVKYMGKKAKEKIERTLDVYEKFLRENII